MNVGIISKDHLLLNKISEKVDTLLDTSIIQKYNTFDSFLKNRRNFCIDCIFIDLSLENWLEKSKEIKEKFQNIGIVFVSDDLHDSYKVYEVEHISFIFKEDLSYVEQALKLCENRFQNEKFVHFSWKSTLIVQKAKDILYFERDKRRTIIHMKNGETWITYKHIDDFEKEVIEDFIRIHVSFLVNRNHFKTVTRDKIQLVDGTYVPISRKYMKQFKGMYE